MSDIDPEKLARAIEDLRDELGRLRMPSNIANATILIAAAEQVLATLPRYKEVEVEMWAVVRKDGTVFCCDYDATEAVRDAAPHGHSVVRLTGTAKVKVAP